MTLKTKSCQVCSFVKFRILSHKQVMNKLWKCFVQAVWSYRQDQMISIYLYKIYIYIYNFVHDIYNSVHDIYNSIHMIYEIFNSALQHCSLYCWLCRGFDKQNKIVVFWEKSRAGSAWGILATRDYRVLPSSGPDLVNKSLWI